MDTNEACLLRGCRRIGLAMAVAAGCAALPASAAEFDAEVTLGATHTDNVTLASVDEQSELVYRVEPSLHLSHETSRITANGDYRLQAFRYRDFDEQEVFHQYDVSLRADLIPETFFFDVGGSRSQSIRDPQQRIPQGNLPISGNRQDRDQYYASPSFQYGLGSSVLTRGEYRHTWIDYDDDGTPGFSTQGNEQAEASFSIDNYQEGRGLAWALRYNWQETEYDEEIIPWEYQRAMAEVGVWAGGNTRLFASGGLESAWDDPLDPALEDTVWEVGLSQQVGERLSAEIAAGERSFGRSWRGSLDFQFRRGSTSLSYTETPTTEGRNRIRRSLLDELELPDDFLSRPGSAERFIQNRLEWRLNLDFQRTSVSLALFDTDRTDRTQPDGTPLGDESQRGATLSASYRLGARTDLTFRGSHLRREFRSSDSSDLFRGSLGLQYRLGGRTSLLLEYEHTEEDGDSPLSTRDYEANNVSLLVTRTLF